MFKKISLGIYGLYMFWSFLENSTGGAEPAVALGEMRKKHICISLVTLPKVSGVVPWPLPRDEKDHEWSPV